MKKLTFEWQSDNTCTIYINGKVTYEKLTLEQAYAVAPGLESLANSLNYEIEVKHV